MQRILSFLLVLAMVFGMVPPVAVGAEETVSAVDSDVETVAATEETAVETTGSMEETESVEESTDVTVTTFPEEKTVEEMDSSNAERDAVLDSGSFGNASWSLSEDYVLTLSATGELVFSYTIESKQSPWYEYRRQISALVIAEGVTSIPQEVGTGNNSFGEGPNIASVTLPASLKELSTTAFSLNNQTEYIVAENSPWFKSEDGILYSKDGKFLVRCPRGKEGTIHIPSGVTLGEDAFMFCDKLTRVIIDEGITEIPKQAFHNCTALTGITLPESLCTIGPSAFSECNSLTAIDIPDNVSKIGSHAFYNCYNLESIVIPEGVTVLDNTFRDCSKLSRITLPSTLKELKGSVFWWCRALKELHLPEGITKIPYMSFDSTGLQKITIPETVTEIEYWSFSNSNSLERVVFGSNVKTIGDYAFYCKGLKTIAFTGKAPTIADNAFASAVATVYYPEGDTSWDGVINQNYGGTLTWVAGEAPPESSNIQWTFDETTGTLTISALEPGPMDDYTMSTVPWKQHREDVKSVVIEESVTSIGAMAFCNFQALTSVTIPGSITTIGAQAFYYCNSLLSVTIPAGVTSINKQAFYDCKQLAELSLPRGLEWIGDEAFRGCKALTELRLPEGLSHIGVSSFAECVGLTTVDIPASVIFIDAGAFGNCNQLQAFTVAEGNTRYAAADGILYDADLRTLILAPTAISGTCIVPKTVRYIQDKAFWRCANLKELIFGDHISSIGTNAFYETTLTVCYPRGYASWKDKRADYGGTVTWVQIGLVTASGETGYASSATNWKGKLKFEYSDEWVYEDTTKWHPKLARMSLRMAMSGSQDKADDIKALYQELELENMLVRYPEPTPETEGYIIGSRMVRPSAEEETSMFVVVTVRGGGCGPELAQNFELGFDSEHSRYRYTANNLVSEIRKHIEATGVTENIRIWITGFGRGGSIANIAAHRLNTYADEGKIPGLSRDGIVAYCFGNSNVVKKNSSDYQTAEQNIFNLINPNDYTAYLPFSNWGYVRYGTDYFLPTSMHMFTEYGKAYAKMQQNFVTLLITTGSSLTKFDEDLNTYVFDFGIFLPEVPLQSMALGTISGDLSAIFMDEYAYTRDNQTQIMDAVMHLSNEVCYPRAGFLLKIILKLLPGKLVKQVIECIEETVESFNQAHWPELWVAWLDAIDDDKVLQLSLDTRYLTTNCPVDLSVYDSNGNLVAQFIDNVPQRVPGSRIRAYLDANDQKIVVLPTDEAFRIVTEATDEGTVSYQVQECTGASGEITRVIDYLEIPIQTGDTLSCTAGSGTNATYTVLDQQGILREPDMERTGSEIVKHQLTVLSEGDGSASGTCTAIANEFVKVQAESAEDSLFLGWFAEGRRVSEDRTYRFRLESDTELTAKFLRKEDCNISLQEYIALKHGDTILLEVEAQPSALTEFVQWSKEDDRNILSVDDDGAVTGNAVGTAYVLATVQIEDTTLTARCRIDVGETEVSEQEEELMILEGVQLGTTKVTTELYSTNYAGFEILLQLPQNYSAASIDSREPENYGVTLESAQFTDPDMAALFDLVVLDDRRVQVIPTETAIEKALESSKAVKSSYSSTVSVTIAGQAEPMETAEKLTLAVKQSKPKLTAKIASFNSFYTGQAQEIHISGGSVTDISLNAAKNNPSWLELKDHFLILTEDAPAKSASAKVYLIAETEEWAIPAQVTLSAKNTYRKPSLKLSSSTVTMTKDSALSGGVNLTLKCSAKGDTLEKLSVVDISVSSDYEDSYSVSSVDLETGRFLLKAKEGFQAGKISLDVSFDDTDSVLTLPLTVKTAAVALKRDKSSITLNRALTDSAVITVTATPADYALDLTEDNIRLADSKGKTLADDSILDVKVSDNKITVATNDSTPTSGTYRLYVSAGGSKEVYTTIKLINKVPTVSFKAKGTLDLSFPGNSVTISPSFKNYVGGTFQVESWSVVEKKGKTILDEDAKDCFRLDEETMTLTWNEDNFSELTSGNTYEVTLKLTLPGVTDPVSGKVTLTMKRTAIKLKLGTTKLSLNKLLKDAADVSVSCATKGYAFKAPILELWDSKGKNKLDSGTELVSNSKLHVTWERDRIHIKLGEDAGYGERFQIKLKANAYSLVQTLKVNILTEAKSRVSVSVKAKGSIDVIRAGTQIILTPGYKNCTADKDWEETLLVYTSASKYRTAIPAEKLFDIEEVNGTYILTAREGLDSGLKYKIQIVSKLGDQEYRSSLVSISVKMGSAKLTMAASGTTLFAKDKNDRVEVVFTAKDETLNLVERIEIKDSKYKNLFAIHEYGNGEFAIGFADGIVDKSIRGKTVTLNVNVFLEGNVTGKANAAVKLRLTVVE